MEVEEFNIKIDICEYLALVPLWILRNAPEIQFSTMKARNGLILPFKSQIYPYGQELLTKSIWENMRLPVTIWDEMPEKIVKRFLGFHKWLLGEKKA